MTPVNKVRLDQYRSSGGYPCRCQSFLERDVDPEKIAQSQHLPGCLLPLSGGNQGVVGWRESSILQNGC